MDNILPELPPGKAYAATLEKIMVIDYDLPSDKALFISDNKITIIIELEDLREAIKKGMYNIHTEDHAEETSEEELTEPIAFKTSNTHRALAVIGEWADDPLSLIQAWLKVKELPTWSTHMLSLGGVPQEACKFVDTRLRELLED